MLCNQCRKELNANAVVCPNCGTPVPRTNTGFEYTNGVKQSLKSLVDAYGNDILCDTKKFVSFLNDYLPEYEKERRLIKTVLSNDVIKNMLKEDNRKIAVLKAKEFMINDLFLSENACEFILECFTYILGWEYTSSIPQVQTQAVQTQVAPKRKVQARSEVPTEYKEFKAFDAIKYKLKRTVEISDGYTAIEGFAFDSFGFLKAIKLPDSLVTIGEYAFSECKRLKTVVLPKNLRVIKKSAFSSCSKLSAVKIPFGVTAIEEGTFSFCHSLEVVEIPHSVSSIGDEAFTGCEKLKSLFIPDSVKFIGTNVFSLCPIIVIKCYENSYVHKFCLNEGIRVEVMQKGFVPNL